MSLRACMISRAVNASSVSPPTTKMTVVAVALGVGYGMGANSGILANAPQALQLICGESGIVPAAFVAILLNVLLPKNDQAE